MKSFMLDPAAGGGSDVPVDKYKDSAKIASGIYEKLSQKMQNPTAGLQRKRLVGICVFPFSSLLGNYHRRKRIKQGEITNVERSSSGYFGLSTRGDS
jgi:hypothetical protein